MPCKSGVQILGSCNGVLLLDSDIDEELCLWNPSIRMYQKISRPKYTRSSIKYALGYDSINDDFKVVAAVTPTSYIHSVVRVFSSKLSSWKSIGDFGYSCRLYGQGSVLNGAPHWFARGSTDIDVCYFRIACFDVMEEKFKEVPTPIYEVESHFFKVGILDGCLCAVDSRLESHLDVWVMKEYGVKESWTKLFVVSNVAPNVPGESFFEYCELLCFTKDGEFVLRLKLGASVKLAIYNPKRKTFKRIGMPQNWKGFDVDLYVESLVSPLGCNNPRRY
ncbi:F-box protein CPR1-like [Rhododendron vialii]|uniref:F-box protein CPR1-like n=1 Tax=Rhododendron vialii TaxID=182163 RepID=UPI00265E60B1|nr:F-box protein CPR1-like [Rhododendron vialii]